MNLQEWFQSRQGAYRRVLAIVLVLAVTSIVVWANHRMQVSVSGSMTGKDFMSLWTGAKAVVLGLNPYDVDTWGPLRTSCGSTWNPDPMSPWPLWTHLLLVPLSFVTPEMAGAIWMTICELSLVLGVSLLIRAAGWEEKSALYALSVGSSLFRPVFPAIFNGQVSPALFLILVAAYFLHRRGRPFIAGLLLSLELVKPNVTAILLFTVGVALLFRKDWRTLTGLAAGVAILLIFSWVMLPGWLFRWLFAAVTRKGGVAGAVPTVWGLAYEWIGAQLWPYSAVVIFGLLYSGLLILLWKQREEDLLFGLGLTVIASTFLAPYLWAYEYVVLLFPACFALFWGLASNQGPTWVWWAGWWLVTVVLSWVLFLVAQQRGRDTWSAVLPLASLCYFAVARLALSGAAEAGSLANSRSV
jgi:hypothetical protein